LPARFQRHCDLPVLASSLQMKVDIASLWRKRRRCSGRIGRDIRPEFAEAETNARKQLFARNLLAHVPLAGHIR
jgi:hypothetical protein